MTDRKKRTTTDGRNPDGTFGQGNQGRAPGARNKVTRAALDALEANTGALTDKAVELALDGDTVALRMCLDRVCPPLKDRPVDFSLPAIESVADAAQAASAVLAAVAAGDLTPTEGASVMGLVDSYRRTLEATEFEARISKLEDANARD